MAEQKWPDYVMLRDTELHDDQGGLGQRIYTTAGAGYVKEKYVRARLSQAGAGECCDGYEAQIAVLQQVIKDRDATIAALSPEERERRLNAAVEARKAQEPGPLPMWSPSPPMQAIKGDDYQNKGQTHKTFGITITNAWTNIHGELQPHGNMIEVYRIEAVRNRILTLLERHDLTDEPSPSAGEHEDTTAVLVELANERATPPATPIQTTASVEAEATFDRWMANSQLKLALRTLHLVAHYLPAIMDYHAPASGLTGRQVVERIENTIAALSSPATPEAVSAPANGEVVRRALELAANEGYRVCAETRHVTLGDKVRSAIRALSNPAPDQVFTIEHDGFRGTPIGSYTTREGKRGVVLQQIDTKVVHVYGEKWLKKE